MPKYLQGFYIPKNKEKYVGSINQIVYRSSYELRLFRWLDECPYVLKWNSEEVKIPYVNPFDGRIHHYYVDAIFKFKDKNDVTQNIIAEIKPSDQCVPPKPPKQRMSSIYKTKVKTYIINQAKWQAAKDFAEKNGMKFIIITEKHLEAFR